MLTNDATILKIKHEVLYEVAKMAYEGMMCQKNPTEAQKRFRKQVFENLIAEKSLNLSRLSRRRRKEVLRIIAE